MQIYLFLYQIILLVFANMMYFDIVKDIIILIKISQDIYYLFENIKINFI